MEDIVYYMKDGVYSPDIINTTDGGIIINPTPESYIQLGFIKIELNDIEVEGALDVDEQQTIDIPVDEPEQIIQKTPEELYTQLVELYIRRKYSVSAEIAILRQRDTKPDEYAEYYKYCEECKVNAKHEVYES